MCLHDHFVQSSVYDKVANDLYYLLAGMDSAWEQSSVWTQKKTWKMPQNPASQVHAVLDGEMIIV